MGDLSTYDPDWKRRWRRAKAVFDSLPETAVEVRRTAATGMRRAHDAQFRTVEELADFQFRALKQSASRAGFMLALQPFGPEATLEDLERVWREAGAVIAAAQREASRRPIAHPPGLAAFGPDSEARTVRSVETFEYERLGQEPQTWTVLIERRGSDAYVCLVARERHQSVFNDFAHLATATYQNLLAPPSWRPWAGVGPRQVHFYATCLGLCTTPARSSSTRAI